MEMTIYANGVYQNDGALEVLYSRDHQIARCIVRMYHKGIGIPEICNKLEVSQQRISEVLL